MAKGLKTGRDMARTSWEPAAVVYRDMTVYMLNLFGELEIWNTYGDYYDGLPADFVITDVDKIASYMKLGEQDKRRFYLM